MSKSKNKSRSELEHLKGQIRELKAELKYYKRRAHIETSIIDDVIEDGDLEDVNAYQCPSCKSGALIEFDFKFAVLRKCSNCGHEERKGKAKASD
jgi:hypothetical protein